MFYKYSQIINIMANNSKNKNKSKINLIFVMKNYVI